MTSENKMDDKTIAIIAHITVIGWVIAIVMNNNDKSEFASFYIRQMLGIIAIGVLGFILPFIGILFYVIAIALWVISLIGAASGEKKELPVVGEYFQDWFNSL